MIEIYIPLAGRFKQIKEKGRGFLTSKQLIKLKVYIN